MMTLIGDAETGDGRRAEARR